MQFVVKCKECDSEAHQKNNIRTCEVFLWCDTCRVAEFLYQYDQSTFDKFYKVEAVNK